MNEYSHIRSEVLTIPSIEFFAILLATCYFLFRTERSLIEFYIILVPFNDSVYRILSLQPSDILAFLIILFNLKHLSSKLGYLYWITPFLLIGSLVGLMQFGDSFSIQYCFRLILVFGVVNVISAHLQSEQKRISILNLYKKVVWFSILVALSQIIFWYLGFPVAGVFETFGIPRMKGLSHEPATFCFWLVLSLPFGFLKTKSTRLDWPYILALLSAILATGSITGIIATVAFIVSFFASEIKNNLNTALKYLFAFVLTITIVISSGNPLVLDYFGGYTIGKVNSYVAQMFFGETSGEVNGRSGDKQLLKYFQENPALGIGAFRSSRIQEASDIQDIDEYIAAANFYITTPTEFGIMGTLCLAWIFVRWTNILYKLRTPENKVLGLALISWLVFLAGLRVFGFHQPWLIMSLYASMSSGSETKHSKT
jgi:O-Antigen ligase